MVIMLNIHPRGRPTSSARRRWLREPDVPIRFYRDSFGNICGRLVAPAGGVTAEGPRAGARHRPARRGDAGRAAASPIEQSAERADALPDAEPLLRDRQATPTSPGRCSPRRSLAGLVSLAITEFVHKHVTFGYEHAHHMKSAHDVYEQKTGVCRDFAHLAVALCRCMGIPARYCTGYMGDIGIPPDPSPMDFSGWFRGLALRQMVHLRRPPQHPPHRPHPDGAQAATPPMSRSRRVLDGWN